MSIRVSRRAPKSLVAMSGLIVAAIALTGCSSLGSRTFGDPVTTGSVPQSAPASYNQPMPAGIGAPQMAENQFLPPANIGGGGGGWNASPVQTGYTQPSAPFVASGSMPAVQSQDLPVLSSTSPMGSQPAMQAQPSFASAAPMPSPAVLGTLPSNNSVPTVAPASTAGGTFKHTIASGESLYTIARRYDVTTQSIVQANNLGSPDKIVVGQAVIIPGRADLLQTKAPASAPVQVASAAPALAPIQQPLPAGVKPLQAAAVPAPAPQQAAPANVTQVASIPTAEPTPAANTKFRWPVSGRVLTDFAGSKGTGINIEASEGSAIKAAETGTVIYVGSGVEGYGNLILIRHPNGYVSAYAHLKSMSVAKGANVSRGDTIGAAGQTGSVSQPQLHFELRKGATPVDPMPLLAS